MRHDAGFFLRPSTTKPVIASKNMKYIVDNEASSDVSFFHVWRRRRRWKLGTTKSWRYEQQQCGRVELRSWTHRWGAWAHLYIWNLLDEVSYSPSPLWMWELLTEVRSACLWENRRATVFRRGGCTTNCNLDNCMSSVSTKGVLTPVSEMGDSLDESNAHCYGGSRECHEWDSRAQLGSTQRGIIERSCARTHPRRAGYF